MLKESPFPSGIKPRVIIGLGNPKIQYDLTYHNVGILFINRIIKISNFSCEFTQKSKLFEFCKFNEVILIKPLIFMNESGKAVKMAINYFKIKPEEILIIHDDSDIELGKYKISFGRSSAGHRGVDSIIKSLGTKDFWRLRIGIRKNQVEKEKIKRKKAGELVLKKIIKKDLEILDKVFQIIIANNSQFIH